MKNETVSLCDWRPLVLWSIIGIVVSHLIVYLLFGPSQLRMMGILYSFLGMQMWGTNTFTTAYCAVVHIIFALFCLWWYRTRHPFFYALVPLAALSCSAFSMYATHLLSAALGMEAYPVVRTAIIAHLVLIVLCLWWWRTKSPALYIWLPLALLASSPFGIGFMLLLFA